MAGIKTNGGKKVFMNRMYKTTPDYTIPSQFKVGTGSTAPNVADTDLESSVPIGDGTTLDDGSNTFTGSNGGDNSTDNIIIYKPGAGLSDNTAQNLIANDTNVIKTWTIAAVTAAVVDKETAAWLYIADDTALNKISTVEIKLGSDSSNYYSKLFTVATGWNWLQFGVLNTNTETGTVGSPVEYYEIDITTNNTTDEFAAGDVVVDLLRQWEDTDELKDFKADSLALDEINHTAQYQCELLTGEAVGFDLTELGTFNEDGTPIMDGRDTYDAKSKSSADEFKYTITDGLE